MDEFLEEEKRRLTAIVMRKRVPCLVCNSPNIAGAGTWVPDEKHRVAVKRKDTLLPVFAFTLCRRCSEPTDANEKIIIQTILHEVRLGKKWEV